MDSKEETFNFLHQFPAEFTEFLLQNKVPLTYYSDQIFQPKNPVRYIRFKPLFPSESYLETSLNLKPKIPFSSDFSENSFEKLEFLSNFYSIPETMKISNLKAYIEGNLYGIDLSSACVVLALNPKKADKILDLCCCPGAKLLFIGDLMMKVDKNPDDLMLNSNKNPGDLAKNVFEKGCLIGVDINRNRLRICQSLLKKYGLEWVQLKECDGTEFKSEEGFDKVLVDAECTHDGSIKHLKKYLKEYQQTKNLMKKCEEKGEIPEEKGEIPEEKQEITEENKGEISYKKHGNSVFLSNKEKKRRLKQRELNINVNKYISDKQKKNEWTMDDFKERVLDKKKLKEITDLQLKLLRNGFSLLKKGGVLIYSTCSFIISQNEGIIDSFCQENKEKCQLIEVFPEYMKEILRFKEGFLAKTVRFNPITSQSGGMFIAALKKI